MNTLLECARWLVRGALVVAAVVMLELELANLETALRIARAAGR